MGLRRAPEESDVISPVSSQANGPAARAAGPFCFWGSKIQPRRSPTARACASGSRARVEIVGSLRGRLRAVLPRNKASALAGLAPLSASITEDRDGAGHRVLAEPLSAQRGQPSDPAAELSRLAGVEGAALRGQLQVEAGDQRHSPTRPGGVPGRRCGKHERTPLGRGRRPCRPSSVAAPT